MASSNESSSKNLIHAKAKMPNVQSLVEFGKLLKGKMRKDFDDKYGKILSLMEVNVQVEAITALSQFYDPPYRCFTFQDFQMAPTLEEYEQILGFPLENSKPYHYIGHYPSLSTVASILKVNKGQLSAVTKNLNCVDGIPLAYLKERLNLFHKEQDWTAFTDVLALTIFGIVLFPNMDEYVDFAAIDVFLAVRNQGHNPVPAVLADTYYVLNSCHEMKKKRILCCLPALYVWVITHIFHGVRRASSCPIVDFKECFVKDKSKQDWAKYLRNLNERTVRWYPKWREVNKVIYQCGTFPNVPLLGTKGCINYNPSLALRQLCYPIMHPPNQDGLTDPFIVHGIDAKDTQEHRRIKMAWNQIVLKGRELGKRSTDAHVSYRQWLKQRVLEIKLPFSSTLSTEHEMPEPTPITKEEVEGLRAALIKSEEEKKELQETLEKSYQENKDLRLKNTNMEEFIETSNKRLKMETIKKLREQECLRGADEELTVRDEQLNNAIDKAFMWKGLWSESNIGERNVQREHKDLKQQLKEMVVKYEKQVKNEKQQEQLEVICKNLIEELKEKAGCPIRKKND